MRLVDIIDTSPWPSLPVFLISVLMPFVYVAMASGNLAAGPGVDSLTDAVMVTVLVRVALHLALKIPAAVNYARQQGGIDPMLGIAATCVSVVLVALVWTNSATAAKTIWSAILSIIGGIELWQALRRHDGPPLTGDVGAGPPVPDHAMVQAVNLLLFAVICAVLSVLASETIWVAYAAIGWIVQHWVLAAGWGLTAPGHPVADHRQ